jgi:hypothetical protein
MDESESKRKPQNIGRSSPESAVSVERFKQNQAGLPLGPGGDSAAAWPCTTNRTGAGWTIGGMCGTWLAIPRMLPGRLG